MDQVDIYREKMYLAIISLQIRISELELVESRSLRSLEMRQQETTTVPQEHADAGDNAHTPPQGNENPTPRSEPARDSTRPMIVCSSPVPESVRAPRVKLPKVVLKWFNGRSTEWATFWDMFQSSIHNNPELSDIDWYNYLHSLLESPAANSNSCLSLTATNYSEAIAVLQKRFGNKQQVINKHMDAFPGTWSSFINARPQKTPSSLWPSWMPHLVLEIPRHSFRVIWKPPISTNPDEAATSRTLCYHQQWSGSGILECGQDDGDCEERDRGMRTSNYDRPTAAVLVATSPTSLNCYYCGEQYLSASCRCPQTDTIEGW